MFRRLRNFWIPCVTTMILACFSHAAAQASYKVTDLGARAMTIWVVPCPSTIKAGRKSWLRTCHRGSRTS